MRVEPIEDGFGGIGGVFGAEGLSYFAGAGDDWGGGSEGCELSPDFPGKAKGGGAMAASKSTDLGCPERLIGEEGADQLGGSSNQSGGGGAGTAVVEKDGGMGEHPFVWGGREDEDRIGVEVGGQLSPALDQDAALMRGAGIKEPPDIFFNRVGAHAAKGDDGKFFTAAKGFDRFAG